MIAILLGKRDNEFNTFCDMLERSNHSAWANRLRQEAEWYTKWYRRKIRRMVSNMLKVIECVIKLWNAVFWQAGHWTKAHFQTSLLLSLNTYFICIPTKHPRACSFSKQPGHTKTRKGVISCPQVLRYITQETLWNLRIHRMGNPQHCWGY